MSEPELYHIMRHSGKQRMLVISYQTRSEVIAFLVSLRDKQPCTEYQIDDTGLFVEFKDPNTGNPVRVYGERV